MPHKVKKIYGLKTITETYEDGNEYPTVREEDYPGKCITHKGKYNIKTFYYENSKQPRKVVANDYSGKSECYYYPDGKPELFIKNGRILQHRTPEGKLDTQEFIEHDNLIKELFKKAHEKREKAQAKGKDVSGKKLLNRRDLLKARNTARRISAEREYL